MKYNIISISTKFVDSKFFKIVLLLISLIYSLQFNFWSTFPDDFYYLNILDFYDKDFMICGSLAIGKIWCSIFGKTLVGIRLLNWIFCVSALGIIINILRKHTNKSVYLLCLGLLLMGYTNKNMYNPSTLTIICTVTISALLLSRSTSLCHLSQSPLSYSFLCALACVCRFPNVVLIVFVPFCVVLIDKLLLKNNNNYLLLWVIKYLFFFIIIYYLLLALLLCRMDILYLITDKLSSEEVDQDSRHTLEYIASNYWYDFKKTFSEISYPLAIFIIGFVLSKIWKPLSLASLPICWKLYPKIIGPITWYGAFSWYKYISIITMLIVVYCCIILAKTRKKQSLILFVVFFVFCVTNASGSDTGIQNLFPYSAIFLPLFVFLGIRLHVWNLYTKVIGVFFITLHLYASLSNNFMYESLFDPLKKMDNCYVMQGTYLEKDKANNYERMLSDVSKYGNIDHNIFYGITHSHEMYAMTQSKMLYKYSFWMRPDWEKEISYILNIMKEDPTCVLFYEYDDYSKFDQLDLVAKTEEYYVLKTRKNGNDEK